MAKIHKFGLANSLLDSPMATWLTLTGTLRGCADYRVKHSIKASQGEVLKLVMKHLSTFLISTCAKHETYLFK